MRYLANHENGQQDMKYHLVYIGCFDYTRNAICISDVHLEYFRYTSGQPLLRMECLGGINSPPPPGSTEVIAFSCESES